VKADGAEQRHEQKTAQRRKLRRQCRRRAQQDQGHNGQHLFADEQDQQDHSDCEESGDFPYRVEPADIGPVEPRNLDDEVVQKRRPRGERDRHGKRHQRQQSHRPPPKRQAFRVCKGDRSEGIAKCHCPAFTPISGAWRGEVTCDAAQT
jgi:hypothetical protein